jgi:hypothetical protein
MRRIFTAVVLIVLAENRVEAWIENPAEKRTLLLSLFLFILPLLYRCDSSSRFFRNEFCALLSS